MIRKIIESLYVESPNYRVTGGIRVKIISLKRPGVLVRRAVV